jgi:hypothetical protein
METNQPKSGRQSARLAGQVWQCDDGTSKTGAELAQRLSTLGTFAFPFETVERSSIGVIVQEGMRTWQRIE